jgi:hypothetical protein
MHPVIPEASCRPFFCRPAKFIRRPVFSYFPNGENYDENQTFPMYRMPDLHGDLLLAAFWRKYHEAISHPCRGRLAAGAGDQRLPGL